MFEAAAGLLHLTVQTDEGKELTMGDDHYQCISYIDDLYLFKSGVHSIIYLYHYSKANICQT